MKAFVLITAVLLLMLVSPGAASDYKHVVEPGDTLYGIAQNNDVCWELLAERNGIKEPTRLQIGNVLILPGSSQWEDAFADYTEADKILLARIIYAEARGECLEGQIAVGAVVLNRVKSDEFPDSIQEVVYDPGQFTPAENGSLPRSPSDASATAAARALAGEDPTQGALYFYNPQKTNNRSFWETRQVIRRIGNHNFAM